MAYKFDDCRSCANRRRKWICGDCDVGEFYEDEDAITADRMIEAPAVRFGETVTADDTPNAKGFDADRFADGFTDDDEDPNPEG